MTLRPRVFVSSVMDGFEEQRAAARAGVEAAGCEAVLIDDYPALAVSPRNACLEAVDSCEAIVVILGERGGWTTPSGKLVVEEEYEHARSKSKAVLVFIQDGTRDADAERLREVLAEYVRGNFRRSFANSSELQAEVEAACRRLARTPPEASMDTARFDELLSRPHSFDHEAVLRVVVAPKRQDETVFELEQLDDEAFQHRLVGLGVSREVGLFEQNEARQVAQGANSLTVNQGADLRGRRPGLGRRLEVFEDGHVVIDIAVAAARDHVTSPFAPLAVEDVQAAGATALRLVDRLYEDIDPYGRYAGLACSASLGELGGRQLLPRSECPQPGAPVSIMMHKRGAEPTLSFDRPESISRTDVAWVDIVASRIARRLERRLNTGSSADSPSG